MALMDILFYILFVLSVFGTFFLGFQILFSILYYVKLRKIPKISSVPEPISVLIPYYRESSESIQRTLDSLSKQIGVELEVILVDDGNEEPVVVNGDNFKKFKHLHLQKNMGKRKALHVGVHECTCEKMVVVDSDTVLKENAILELYRVMIHEKAGCVCGNIEIENETENLLTLLVSCMYWFAFHMERSSQSYFGSQTVCSGALSMYSTSHYKTYSQSLITQRALGVEVRAGDDRHMTNQFLMHGHRSVWARDAIAWTKTPSTLPSFIKQQLRWTRSFVLEVCWLFTRFGGQSYLSRFGSIYKYFIFRNLFKYVYALAIYIIGAYFIFVYPFWFLLFGFSVSLLLISLMKGLLSWVISGKWAMILKTMGFGLFGYALLTPFLLYGVFTCKKNDWLTRK